MWCKNWNEEYDQVDNGGYMSIFVKCLSAGNWAYVRNETIVLKAWLNLIHQRISPLTPWILECF